MGRIPKQNPKEDKEIVQISLDAIDNPQQLLKAYFEAVKEGKEPIVIP